MTCGPVRFAEKVCIVSGGDSGIGRAVSERFAAEGGRVLLVDRDDEHSGEIVRAIGDAGGTAAFAKADVSVSGEVRAAIATAVERWGRIDVIVNNAAVMTYTPIAELADDEWDRVLGVNLRAAFLLCKYALPHMRPGSAVVNVSSVHAHATTPNVVPYAASKGGLEAFTRGVSREWAPHGVRINCVAPGAVETPLLRDNPNVRSGAEKVEGAIGQPEDLAAVIAFLASDEARFVNGATLVADGGRLDLL